MQLDAGLEPTGSAVEQQAADRTLGVADLALLGGNEIVNLDRPVALAEHSDGITIRVLAIELVIRSALKMQLQLALRGFGNYNRALRQSEPRTAFPAGFRQEHTVPLS